jgi:hypothetical protein
MTQVVEHLPSKQEALSSNSSTTKKRKEKQVYDVAVYLIFTNANNKV